MRRTNRCFGCLKESDAGYCRACLKKLFNNKKVSHILPFSKPEFERAKIARGGRLSISGVQPKHSLRLSSRKLELTETGGEYILKPIPPGSFPKLKELPANEHLTMQLAGQIFGINSAANALIFFKDDEPAYLTKRFDRLPDGIKLDQEDFSQIAGRTEEIHGENYKYDFSYEEIGELIKAHVGPSLIELEKFFKLVAFNYLVHNGDAHIKNFSLFRNSPEGFLLLTPAYDLANTRLHLPEEADTALDLFKGGYATPSFTANAYYAKDDFVEFGKRLGIHPFRVERILDLLVGKQDSVNNLINNSFLEEETKTEYRNHIADRVKRLSYSFSKDAPSASSISASNKKKNAKKKPASRRLD